MSRAVRRPGPRWPAVLFGFLFLAQLLLEPPGTLAAPEPAPSKAPAALAAPSASEPPSPVPSPDPSGGPTPPPSAGASAPASPTQAPPAPTATAAAPTATAPTATAPATPVPTIVPVPTPTPTIAPTTTPAPAPPSDPPGTELIDERTATSRTFANGDGTFTTEIASEPIFYKPAGATWFVPIELDFSAVVGADKAARAAKGPVAVSVAPANDARGFLSLEAAGRRISLKPLPGVPATGSAEPTLEKNSAGVADVLPGVDLRIFSRADGVTSFLVLDGPTSLASFSFLVEAPGLTLVPQADGSLSFVDAAGKTFAVMPRPYALDSSGDEQNGGALPADVVTYAVGELDGVTTLTVAVDPTWLAKASYPVYIDPSVTIYNDGTNTYGDAHVNQGNPTLNYANYQRPDAPTYYELWLGQDPSDANAYNEAFIRFDLTSLAGTTIDGATMEVRPYHQYYDAPTATTTWLRRVTASWTETGITWNTKPAITTTGTVSAGCVEYTQCGFDVTTLVQQWVSATYPNYGVRLDENGNGATYWKRLIASEEGSSTRPRLLVSYHLPVATAVTPAGGAWRNSRLLDWSFSDPAGHTQAGYEIEVDNASNFLDPLTWSYLNNSGTATSISIPTTTALTAGTTYYWRVRVRDGTSWSAWDTESFRWDGSAPSGTFSVPAAGTLSQWNALTTVTWAESDAGSGVTSRSLQRQKASLNGDGTCATSWANDGAAGTSASPSTQTLVAGSCYRWQLTLTDAAGNSSTTTSGVLARNTSGQLGRQDHQRFESWDLGADDSLAVNVATGNLVLSHPLVTLPIRGSSVPVSLGYNSHDPRNIGLGSGWRLNLQRRLTLNADGTVTFTDGDGSRHTFTNPVTSGTVTTYTRPATLYATLRKDTAQTVEFTLTHKDQSRDTFDILGSDGLLIRSEDHHGNGVTLTYGAGTTNIATVSDTAASRTVDFSWDTTTTPNRLTSITDWAYVDAAGVVQTTNTGSRRSYRFFFDASGQLAGWSDPLNTTGSCPTGGSHLTCLVYTGGLVSGVKKTQTVETLTGGSLGTTSRVITTAIAYAAGDVSTITDSEQMAQVTPQRTTFTRESAIRTRVDRPTTTTSYGWVAANDAYARTQSVWRKLDATTSIEQRTTWNASFPTEPATVTDNYGALLGTPARALSYTYVAGSLGNLAKLVEPLTTTTNRWTEYLYNADDEITQKTVSQDGSTTLRTVTRFCYAAGCLTTDSGPDLLKQIDNYVSGGAQDDDTNVTTEYAYDAYGQKTQETRHNRDAAAAVLDDRIDELHYDASGNLIAEIVNYADGQVTGGSDVIPDAATLARTDLTTVHTYDTAGNRVSTADPRRAIIAASGSVAADDYLTRWTFDPLNEQLSEKAATTPGITTTQKTSVTKYDELGNDREETDFGGVTVATEYDRAGHATATFEQPAAGSPRTTVRTTYNAGGLTASTKDERQAADASLGATDTAYDALDRPIIVTEAAGTSAASDTVTAYDGLGRRTFLVVGADAAASLETSYGYDLGGRTTKTDDGFTCTQVSYDHRDVALTTTSGLLGGTCGDGPDKRVVSHAYDGLARVTRDEVTSGPNLGDRTTDDVYDAAGNKRISATRKGTVTSTTLFSINKLDQQTAEQRADGSTAKTNYDASHNPTDRCFWRPGVTVGQCYAVGTSPWPDPPSQVTTTGYDARDQRVSLHNGATNGTTLYDPDHNYLVKAVYIPTAGSREQQTLSTYDDRHRLASLLVRTCTVASGSHGCSDTPAVAGSDTYGYDANDNRTQVVESNGTLTSDRRYCYDPRNQLQYRNSGAACSSTAKDESYAYDDAGNRTQATTDGTTTIFGYDPSGRLTSAGGNNVTHDSAGRIDGYNGWSLAYDAEGRLVSACKSPTCASGSDRVTFAYDGEGHRTRLEATSASGSVTATEFRYQGDAVVEEWLTDATHPAPGSVVRTYVTDDSGAIVKAVVPSGEPGAGSYLVAWNGHGDALSLSRIEADGTTTLANSFSYDSWGRPTTVTHGGVPDLGFRHLYVGQHDVQWDDPFGLSLHYMHARHYTPALGRFLQPDPDNEEDGLYRYGENAPITNIDPEGTCSYGLRSAWRYWADRCRAQAVARSMYRASSRFVRTSARTSSRVGRLSKRFPSFLRFIEWRGDELRIGDNFRIQFKWVGTQPKLSARLPHYHLRGVRNAEGRGRPGQGWGRHRPWEWSEHDRSPWDRFIPPSRRRWFR